MSNNVLASFSVLMPLYVKDKAEYLELAIESLLTQALLPSEIVIVKDGPLTKDLELILGRFINKNLNLFKIVNIPKNKGLGHALKVGLENCDNELVARMDADDICYPARFEKQITYLNQNPHISLLGTSIEEFNTIPGDLKRYRKLPTQYNKLIKFAQYRNPVNHPTVIFKKSDILLAGSYQHMPLFEDYFLWIRMLQNGYIIENLEEPLLYFRTGNDMIGRRHGISYLLKEFKFLNAIRNLKFISSYYFAFSLLIKLPTRILPKNALGFLYKIFLR